CRRSQAGARKARVGAMASTCRVHRNHGVSRSRREPLALRLSFAFGMLGSAVALDDGLIEAVRIGIGNRSGLEHQPVIYRRIERVDGRVHIEIGPEVTLLYRQLDRAPGELSSR